MKRIIALVAALLGAFVLVGCSSQAPDPVVVTVTAPTVAPTVEPTPDSSDAFLLGILEQTWNTRTPSEKEQLCNYYRLDPQAAFDSFNDGSDGLVTQSLFTQFFDDKCL